MFGRPAPPRRPRPGPGSPSGRGVLALFANVSDPGVHSTSPQRWPNRRLAALPAGCAPRPRAGEGPVNARLGSVAVLPPPPRLLPEGQQSSGSPRGLPGPRAGAAAPPRPGPPPPGPVLLTRCHWRPWAWRMPSPGPGTLAPSSSSWMFDMLQASRSAAPPPEKGLREPPYPKRRACPLPVTAPITSENRPVFLPRHLLTSRPRSHPGQLVLVPSAAVGGRVAAPTVQG